MRAWQDGRDLADVLGLEEVVTSFFAQEQPETITFSELVRLLRRGSHEPGEGDNRGLLESAADVGLVEFAEGEHPADGDRPLRVRSPRLLQAVADLIAAGVPTSEVLVLGTQVRRTLDDTARRFVEIMSDHLFRKQEPGWMPSSEEVPALAELISRIGPATSGALQASFALALSDHVDLAFGEYVDRLSSHLPGRGHALEPDRDGG